MTVSVFDIFSIGLGPSSSHTVGPMRAARRFVQELEESEGVVSVARVEVELWGSLSLTGKGHGTDHAVILGLEGFKPEDTDPQEAERRVAEVRQQKSLRLLGRHPVPFELDKELRFASEWPELEHPNSMQLTAFDEQGNTLCRKVYLSTGGGFISEAGETVELSPLSTPTYPFSKGQDLLDISAREELSIAEIMWANEECWRSEEEIATGLLRLWDVMQQSVERGCHTQGILPGGLQVRRRAYDLNKKLQTNPDDDPASVMDWVSLWALAVNEENAASGRIVTAPTNGASGIIPSVLHYYWKYTKNPTEQGTMDFLLVSAAIGILVREGASLSAAEMGCQGEVGTACGMAAAGLVAALGGTSAQIENAAEIGIEHNLGLTCDPIKGLVQVPCIERNTMGAIKAINAARLAMNGDGSHKVSLDQVIATMKQVGDDMNSIYKETAQGGLAVNVVEC